MICDIEMVFRGRELEMGFWVWFGFVFWAMGLGKILLFGNFDIEMVFKRKGIRNGVMGFVCFVFLVMGLLKVFVFV